MLEENFAPTIIICFKLFLKCNMLKVTSQGKLLAPDDECFMRPFSWTNSQTHKHKHKHILTSLLCKKEIIIHSRPAYDCNEVQFSGAIRLLWSY